MLWKDFLEFKNIILEEKLSKKYKNGNENFSGERVSMGLFSVFGRFFEDYFKNLTNPSTQP
jgi:hypothetical protein